MLRAFHAFVRVVPSPIVSALGLIATVAAACTDGPTLPTRDPALGPSAPSFMMTAGQLEVSDASYAFGNVMVGTKSPSHWFKFVNRGNTTVYTKQIGISGLNHDQFDFDFSATPWCPYNTGIRPGDGCVVGIRFVPTREESSSADLAVIISTDTIIIPMTGTGTAPAPIAQVSPQEVYFDGQQVGTQGTQSFQIKNAGGKDLVLTTYELSGLNPADFAIVTGSQGACPLNVAIVPGAGCTMTIAFKPTALGARAATVSIASNAGTSAAQLYGIGLGVADLSVGMVGVLQGKTITYSITLKNAGPTMAESVVLTDSLPAGTTFASMTASSNLGCTAPVVGAAGQVKCASNSLASGETATLQVTVKLAPSAKASVTNVATVASNVTFDPAMKNNTVAVTTAIGRK